MDALSPATAVAHVNATRFALYDFTHLMTTLPEAVATQLAAIRQHVQPSSRSAKCTGSARGGISSVRLVDVLAMNTIGGSQR